MLSLKRVWGRKRSKLKYKESPKNKDVFSLGYSQKQDVFDYNCNNDGDDQIIISPDKEISISSLSQEISTPNNIKSKDKKIYKTYSKFKKGINIEYYDQLMYDDKIDINKNEENMYKNDDHIITKQKKRKTYLSSVSLNNDKLNKFRYLPPNNDKKINRIASSIPQKTLLTLDDSSPSCSKDETTTLKTLENMKQILNKARAVLNQKKNEYFSLVKETELIEYEYDNIMKKKNSNLLQMESLRNDINIIKRKNEEIVNERERCVDILFQNQKKNVDMKNLIVKERVEIEKKIREREIYKKKENINHMINEWKQDQNTLNSSENNYENIYLYQSDTFRKNRRKNPSANKKAKQHINTLPNTKTSIISKTLCVRNVLFTPLKSVLSQTSPKKFRCLVQIVSLFPKDIYQIARNVCRNCKIRKYGSLLLSSNSHCIKCGTRLSSFFLMKIHLRDKSGELNALLTGEDAIKFFQMTPLDIDNDYKKEKTIVKKINSLENSNILLDCCIKSYSIEKDTKYRIYDTILLA